MKLRADLLMTDDRYVQLSYANPESLSFWGGFFRDYADALTSGSGAGFTADDGRERLTGRYADIDRLDLTWEA